MTPRKEYQLQAKSVLRQKQAMAELQGLLTSIERAERTIGELKIELELANLTYRDRTTTQEDILFLTALLKCANKKLGWEKQVASLKKRAPEIMREIGELIQDTAHPPAPDVCASWLHTMEQVKAAIERLERVGLN